MEITDESLGLAKPKAKPAKGPMRPELDAVRVKPRLGLKQPPRPTLNEARWENANNATVQNTESFIMGRNR